MLDEVTLLHPMNYFSFVVEFVKVLKTFPPLEEEFLTNQAEPGRKLQACCQLFQKYIPGCFSISFISSGETYRVSFTSFGLTFKSMSANINRM
jgi:hypothetical protein